MKNNSIKMKKTLAIIIVVAAACLLGGCGGGGSKSPAVQSGQGRIAAELHFSRHAAGRVAEAATGTIGILVTVTGDYSGDGREFTLTARTEIDPSDGHGKVSMLEMPIGMNHLMTAVATWPDGATETIRYVIPEIRQGELTRGVADTRSTTIANAALALAARTWNRLSSIPKTQIDAIADAVDVFHGRGYDYNVMNIDDVIQYATGNTVTSIDITPNTATALIGGTAQFTAIPMNIFGDGVAATSTWSVTGGIGTINSSGLFTATAAGTGTVTATYGTVSGRASVTVYPHNVCGNGAVETGETCDDTNTITESCAYGQTSCTVCSSTCQSVAGAVTGYCGDGALQAIHGNEQCDDGPNNGQIGYCNTMCSGTILPPVCGNGTVETGETCDDGNTISETCTYGQTSCTVCNSTCQSVAGQPGGRCGDGVIAANDVETCDDGNTTGGDGCSSTCRIDVNSWITIPAGDFVMGCATADASCSSWESPKHTVMLSQYKIQKYEVTNDQYKACVDASACTAPSSADSSTRSPYYGNVAYNNYPVVFVDWDKASAYCAWIGGRLPTEAEWEKAARGSYPREPIHTWGDDLPSTTLATYWVFNVTHDTTEVGTHPAGASYYGAMDMEGNVLEWVNDWYNETYYTTGGSPLLDPPGPGPAIYHVERGGSWNYPQSVLRVSLRGWGLPNHSVNETGLRCAQQN